MSLDLTGLSKIFEGTDFNGEPKAVIVLQDQVFPFVTSGATEPMVVDQAATVYATLKFSIYNGMLSVSLFFDSFDDEDYLRFRNFCSNISKNAGFINISNDGSEHHIVLTMTDKLTHTYFVTAFPMTYVFDGSVPSLTFVCRVENAAAYHLSDVEKNSMVDDLEESFAHGNLDDLELI